MATLKELCLMPGDKVFEVYQEFHPDQKNKAILALTLAEVLEVGEKGPDRLRVLATTDSVLLPFLIEYRSTIIGQNNSGGKGVDHYFCDPAALDRALQKQFDLLSNAEIQRASLRTPQDELVGEVIFSRNGINWSLEESFRKKL